ncbi:Dynein light chain [Paragonimus heterotremus]|uniref:Dynein light chain n=1 Tax=Paragonimus heterotremus TaxID=100268 RepID=A0A8J4SN86_9TREM|nr:Dynein light chain [Paragonimus heterotremus]
MAYHDTNELPVIKNADMPDNMQQFAVQVCDNAMDRYSIEREIAGYVKKEMDKQYGSTWHCVVGSNFGSYVTHETNNFIYFYLRRSAVLLFKSG